MFALVLIAIIYFGYDVTAVNFGLPNELKYTLYLFPVIGLIRGILDPGVMNKRAWKWTITGLGGLMLILSLVFIDDMTPTEQSMVAPSTVSGESGISLANISNTSTEDTNAGFSLSTDNWFGFFGPILMIIGFLLNGKNITTKNERYGEVIKKIRV